MYLIGPVSPPICGPGVKNKNLVDTIRNIFKIDIKVLNTLGWSKNIFENIFSMMLLLYRENRVILSVSVKGRFVLLPVLFITKLIKRDFRYVLLPAGGNFFNEINGLNRVIQKIYLKILKEADYIFVESYEMQNNFIESFNLSQVKYMPNFKFEKQIGYKKQSINDSAIRTVFLSRVKKSKGVEIALRALKKLESETEKEIIFDIYGPIKIGYEEQFKTTIMNYDFASYKGVVDMDKVSNVLAEYDIFLFPTYWADEGFPGVLVDALIAGLPIIATDWCNNGEIITNGENGFLVSPKSVEDLYNKIKKISEQPKLITEIGINNREKARKFYARNVIGDFLDKLKFKNWF